MNAKRSFDFITWSAAKIETQSIVGFRGGILCNLWSQLAF